MTTTFDPTAPLPGPPEPWAATDTPTTRSGPPYHMTEMIAAESALAARILSAQAASDGPAARLAEAIIAAVRDGRPVTVTGCGTSEHAAIGTAEILRDALRSVELPGHLVTSAQAFELSLAPPTRGLVLGVSHEGGTAATNAALAAARATGSRTALITVTGRSPGASLADIVVETHELDQSWCHTVGYLSPLVAASAVGAHIAARSIDPATVAGLIAAGTRDEAGAEWIATRCAGASRLIVIASGADRAAGRELVLKVEEAAWLPSAYRDLETFLHGHLPATDATTALVLILADRDHRPERVTRARGALAAARVVGIHAAAILAADLADAVDEKLTPSGRLLVPGSPDLPAPVASLLGTAAPLQLLTERIARAMRTDPDPIRRDDPIYRAASDAADAVETPES